MTRRVTIAELRKMGTKDLQGEIMGKRLEVAKMRLGIVMQKEKDTGKYRTEKRKLARMLTVLNEKTPKIPTITRTPRRGSSASSESSASSISSPKL